MWGYPLQMLSSKYGDIPLFANAATQLKQTGHMTENRNVKGSFRSESPCIVAAMRAATRRLTQLYDDAMVPTGLRVTQFHVLSELERRSADPPTVGELADILTMERSALGQTLRPLVRDGFVDLGHDKRDGRRRPVRLTRAGKDKV